MQIAGFKALPLLYPHEAVGRRPNKVHRLTKPATPQLTVTMEPATLKEWLLQRGKVAILQALPW